MFPLPRSVEIEKPTKLFKLGKKLQKRQERILQSAGISKNQDLKDQALLEVFNRVIPDLQSIF
jgi:hypothetical protein